MESYVKDFQRKVKNRLFAIEHSGKSTYEESVNRETEAMSSENHLWADLNSNLGEAVGCKFYDGYLPLHSHRRFLGPLIIFFKKALRKLLKIFLGWYLFPIYQRQSHFNGKIVNAVSIEKDILSEICGKINDLNLMIERMQNQSQQLSDEMGKMKDCIFAQVNMMQKEICSQVQNLENDVRDFPQRLVSTEERITVLRKDVNSLYTDLQTKLLKIENLPTDDDKFYHYFEEKFRGPREEIRNRLHVYIPIIQEHLEDWSKGTFVDIGSGRGEWLDILRENGALDYVGVDLNQRQNEICESYGHRTICKDCVQFLAELQSESIDLISGFQIIEHLCLSDLMEVLKQSYRVLKRGGMILFETPNPNNLIVGSGSFFNDPSHKRVLDPGMMCFFAEWCGYQQIQVIDANSHPRWAGIPAERFTGENHEIAKAINDLYWLAYGPQDYALFAIKE